MFAWVTCACLGFVDNFVSELCFEGGGVVYWFLWLPFAVVLRSGCYFAVGLWHRAVILVVYVLVCWLLCCAFDEGECFCL